MNRERISHALNGLDSRHISETMVFAPDTMQGAAERSKTVYNRTYRSPSHRFSAILIAICLVFSLGAVAYAAVESGWFSGRDKEIAPTNTQQFVSESGFEPIRVHGFSNGYTCINSKVIDNLAHDPETNAAYSFKSAMFEYEKNGDRLYFNQDNSRQDPYVFGSMTENYNGTELWYYSYTNKIVPDGYEMTESEKAAEEKGDLIFTYGSEEVFSTEIRSISWHMDGINCNLMQMNGTLSAAELCEMAKAIIDGDTPDPSALVSDEEAGTLLVSGSGLNENYYKTVDFSGKISDLTANSFVMGKEMPVTNMQTGTDHAGMLTIHYGENTVIKTARLYYSTDRYDIFMGSISDLVVSPDYLYEVVLENANASELWAKEIIVSEFIF